MAIITMTLFLRTNMHRDSVGRGGQSRATTHSRRCGMIWTSSLILPSRTSKDLAAADGALDGQAGPTSFKRRWNETKDVMPGLKSYW
jgi:hypothetical protein